MPKDSAYLEAEQKMPTMMEGLQDYPDFENQDNPSNPNHGHHVDQENQG